MPCLPCDFEEKEFEQYFNRELRIVETRFWPPGQRIEGKIGFDFAAFTDSVHVRSLFRWLPLEGLHLEDWMFANLGPFRFPDFRFNMFIQHKRPELYVAGRKTKQWESWQRNFYRFRIAKSQQAILSQLQKHSGDNAIVTYCCPAFHLRNDLLAHVKSGSLVENSNFAQPHRLDGHGTYTFLDPGTFGRAFSKPTDIEGDSFSDMRKKAKITPPAPARQLIEAAGNTIKLAFQEMSKEGEDHSLAMAQEIVAYLRKSLPPIDEGSLNEAVAHISALGFVYQTSLTLMRG